LSPLTRWFASLRSAQFAVPLEGEARSGRRSEAVSARPLWGAMTPGPAGRTVIDMAKSIEVVGLTKRFGHTTAVDDLSFTVPAGSVTGFVGPNGAGKSTTMRMILGLDRPDDGRALVDGQSYAELRRPLGEVGALLDVPAMHPGRRASDHLLWLARSNGIPRRRVQEVLELVGLSDVARLRAGRLSLGMRQRLGIAAALLGDPPILVLDEPANGLDPDGIAWLRAFLRSLAAKGRAILVSSHLMGELEDTADRLVVIRRGQLIAETGVAELLGAAASGGVRIRTPRAPEVIELLAAAGATVRSNGGDVLSVSGLDPALIAGLTSERGLPLHELTPERATLEEAFVQLTRGGGGTAS
jgi:ABC-2 type transport system ATP-binding protein